MPVDLRVDDLAQAEQERANAQRRRWASFCLLGYIAFLLVRVDLLFSDGSMAQNADGSSFNQALSLGLALLLLVTTWRKGDVAASVSLSWPYLLMLGYCLISVVWSVAPDITLRRWGQTVISIWVIWRCSAELGYARTLWFFRATLAVLLVLNFLAVALLRHGVHDYYFGGDPGIVGAWRGLVNSKNAAGPICCMTIILYMFDTRGVSKILHAGVIALAAIFLYFTQSKSSMLSLSFAIMAGLAITMFDYAGAYKGLIRRAILLMLALPIVAAALFDRIEPYIDREAFSGRMRIWSTMALFTRDHFWTGAGFGAFWRSGKASPALTLGQGWVAESAPAGHNSYLDLLVTIGFPGMILAVGVLLLYPVWRLLNASSLPVPCRSLLFAIIFFCAFNSLAETQLLDGKGVDQVFLTMAGALIALIPGVKSSPPAFFGRWRNGPQYTGR